LRGSIDALATSGARLLGKSGELPGGDELQQRVRELLCRHAGHFIELFKGEGEAIVSQRVFVAAVANLFGMHASDVGEAAAEAMQIATAELFATWDLALVGLSVMELNKILHKGGKITVARRAKKDEIFQHEVRAKNQARKEEVPKDRDTLLSEARQSLHGFVIQSREDQLRKRAELVAPVQLEALLSAMSSMQISVLDLFLKWDTNGDGAVCQNEFSAAVAKMGFKFCAEVTEALFKFFDKDGSNAVTLEEIEATLKWGKDKKNARPLLAGWRQLTLSLDDMEVPLHEQMRRKLSEQGKHPRDMFKRWDDSGDGRLDKQELGDLMTTLGGMMLSPGELDKLFASFDTDDSGFVSFKELNAKLRAEVPIEQLMNALSEPNKAGTLSDYFNSKWDSNSDGLLDQQEFDGMLEALGVSVTKEISVDLFNLFDEDSSGAISLKELQVSLRWVMSCEKCQQLRNEAYTFDGTLSIQQQIRRALASNTVRVMELFREWDDNQDGHLTLHEFVRAMPMLGIHTGKDEFRELFESMDLDMDGIVTFKEFNRAMRKEQDSMSKNQMADHFGRDTASDWRPTSPKVEPHDLSSLRKNMRAEHKLRGLGDIELKLNDKTLQEQKKRRGSCPHKAEMPIASLDKIDEGRSQPPSQKQSQPPSRPAERQSTGVSPKTSPGRANAGKTSPGRVSPIPAI